MSEAFKKLFLNLLEWAFGLYDSCLASAPTILLGHGVIDIMPIAESLSSSLKPVCGIIIGICAMTELSIYATHVDTLRFEHGVKIGVKLTLAKVFSEQAPTLVSAIYSQSQVWIINMSGYTSGSGTTQEMLNTIVISKLTAVLNNVSGLGQWLGLFLVALIVAMAVAACGTLIKVMAYGRIFEILAYATISPLPCAFMPLTGTTEFGVNNITKKFFKSFIGVCLHGVVMMICLRLYGEIMCAALDTAVSGFSEPTGSGETVAYISDLLWTMLLGAIALVVAVSKSGSWAKSMMDG